jgi:hypothetical protein
MMILAQGGDERAASVPVGSSATAVDERHRAFRQEVAHHGMRMADRRRSFGRRARGTTAAAAGDRLDGDVVEGLGAGQGPPTSSPTT